MNSYVLINAELEEMLYDIKKAKQEMVLIGLNKST